MTRNKIAEVWPCYIVICGLLGLVSLSTGEESVAPASKQVKEQIKAIERQADQKKQQLKELRQLMQECLTCGFDEMLCQKALAAAKAQIEDARKTGKTDDLRKGQAALNEAEARDKQLKAWNKENTKKFWAGLKKMGLKADERAGSGEEFNRIYTEIQVELADLLVRREKLEPPVNH